MQRLGSKSTASQGPRISRNTSMANHLCTLTSVCVCVCAPISIAMRERERGKKVITLRGYSICEHRCLCRSTTQVEEGLLPRGISGFSRLKFSWKFLVVQVQYTPESPTHLKSLNWILNWGSGWNNSDEIQSDGHHQVICCINPHRHILSSD